MPSQPRKGAAYVGPLVQQPGESDARYWLRLKQVGRQLFDRIESDRLDPDTEENSHDDDG